MKEGETKSEHPESTLKEMRISEEIYSPIHKMIRPQWAPKINFIETFYDTQFKKPEMSFKRKRELGIKEDYFEPDSS